MAEMKQIAGNWRAYESASFRGEWGVETDDPAMVETGDEIILYPSHPKHLAELIAAAPDMAEALAELLTQWEAFEASYGNQEEAYYKLAKYARPAWNKARAALSKAGA